MAGKFVIVDDRFAKFDRALEQGIGRGLEAAARDGIAAAKAKNKRGYRIDGIVSYVGVSKASRGRRGLDVAMTWVDFRARFFEKGTYGNRKGKLAKRTRRKADWSGRGGIQPVRFMAAARLAAQRTMLDHIKRGIRW